jgi:hypothetical protein
MKPEIIDKDTYKETKNTFMPNFLEVMTTDEANGVSLQEYTFIGMRGDNFVFKKRVR